MSTLPEIHVIVIPSKGEEGLNAEKLTPSPFSSVTAVGFNCLNGIPPKTVQALLDDSVNIETKKAPS
jgi:hypothetical protein